ncbi:MAG: hypothetical protein AB7S38_01665 [Vulcanimicrobiota bacterium]
MANDPIVLWNEFLDKCEFVYLTDHPRGVPLDWLQELQNFTPADPFEAELLARLSQAEPDQFRSIFSSFLARRGPTTLMQAPKVPLRLVLEDPTSEPADVLIACGDWDRVGQYVLERAGPTAAEFWASQPQDVPVGVDPGKLPCLKLILLPRIESASPRDLRNLCKKALAMAGQVEARRVVMTHVPSTHPELSDEFAAAEVVSAARDFLLGHKEASLRLAVFHRRTYPHYLRWLKTLGATQPLEADDAPPVDSPSAPAFERILAGGRELVGTVGERLQGALGAGRRMLEGGWLPTYETRQAQMRLELGDHDGALELLGRFGDTGRALPEFVKSLICYDRYLRQGEEADLILARAGLERLLVESAPTVEARLQLNLALAMCYQLDGRGKLAIDLLHQVGQGLRSLERLDQAEQIDQLALAFAESPRAKPFLRGTAPLEGDSIEVAMPFHQGTLAGGG